MTHRASFRLGAPSRDFILADRNETYLLGFGECFVEQFVRRSAVGNRLSSPSKYPMPSRR
jgi:hypothetical protein